ESARCSVHDEWVKAFELRSPGSWAISSPSLAGTARASVGKPLDDEIDCVADRLDLRGLLLGHAHPVGVLELHHELVEVERVGVEVLAKSRLGPDLPRVHLELGREVVADLLQDLFT